LNGTNSRKLPPYSRYRRSPHSVACDPHHRRTVQPVSHQRVKPQRISLKQWSRSWTVERYRKWENKVPKAYDDVAPNCRNWNKVRIIALYVQHRDGVPDEDRRRLFQHARLSLAEQDAVNALTYLGARITRVCLVSSLSFSSPGNWGCSCRDLVTATREGGLSRGRQTRMNTSSLDTSRYCALSWR